MTTFSQRFKELRLEKGLNQKEMADKYSLSRSTIQRYERNQDFPGGTFLIELALEGYNLHWLLTGDGNKLKFTPTSEAPLTEDIRQWLEHVSQDYPEKQEWFRVQMDLNFPEFKEWREQKYSSVE